MAQPPVSQFSGIFLSYRRDDSSGHAGRLFDNLAKHFGEDQIFMDIDTIEPGEDFVEVIEKAVGSCEIVVAVMGPRWLSSSDGELRRLDNPNDFVRLEIATTLKRNIRLIPVLVQKATMPRPKDLPEDIAALSRRNAIEISDSRWQYDVAKLIIVLEKVLAARREASAAEARQAEEERQRQEAEEKRRAEEEKQTRLAAEEANRRAMEERRLQEEKERNVAEEQARHEAAQAAARQAEAERQRLEDIERQRIEAWKLSLVEKETKQRVAEERRRQEEERTRREAEERSKQEAREASRRRAEEERAQAEAETRRRADEEAERLRVEAELEAERRRLEEEEQARAEKERIGREAEADARQHDVDQGLHGSREEKSTMPDAPAVAPPASSETAPQMPDSLALTDTGTRVVLIACVVIVAILAVIWMMQPGSSHRANQTPGAVVQNQIGMELVYLPAGSFMMGSESGEGGSEKPVRAVTFSRGFYIGKYEVTQAQWRTVMGNNPSSFQGCGGNCPVETVSWNDAQEFINKLNLMKDGYDYRLPTEAEWEYACRAGTTGDWSGDIKEMAWFSDNAESRTHPVGQKQPNAWGLRDMLGNVYEWCEDWYHKNYDGAPTDGSAWLNGGEQTHRVVRGGAYFNVPPYLRSPARNSFDPDDRYYYYGFRVVAVRDSTLF